MVHGKGPGGKADTIPLPGQGMLTQPYTHSPSIISPGTSDASGT